MKETAHDKDRIICGLDVGSSKTCLIMARCRPNGRLELVASGLADTHGLSKGMVVNLPDVADSIRRAADEVELKSLIPVESVVSSISGNHIQSSTFRGSVTVRQPAVSPADVKNVIDSAWSAPLPSGQEIIHLLPLEFFLDSRGGIKNPVGLVGSQLDVDLCVINGTGTLIQSMINAANKARLGVRRVVLQSLAAGEAVLAPEEKELGTALVDIGAGTTDVAVFTRDSICFATVIPVGGEHFTRDLVEALRIAREEAERIKLESGSVLPEAIDPDEKITLLGLGRRGPYDLPRRKMCGFLHDRGAELFELVKGEIGKAGVKLIGGCVLTGGGSMLHGMVELAERILDMRVRQGLPFGIDGAEEELSHPVYACAAGLVIHDARAKTRQETPVPRPPSPSLASRLLRLFEK